MITHEKGRGEEDDTTRERVSGWAVGVPRGALRDTGGSVLLQSGVEGVHVGATVGDGVGGVHARNV